MRPTFVFLLVLALSACSSSSDSATETPAQTPDEPRYTKAEVQGLVKSHYGDCPPYDAGLIDQATTTYQGEGKWYVVASDPYQTGRWTVDERTVTVIPIGDDFCQPIRIDRDRSD